jgi:hypothetical protein
MKIYEDVNSMIFLGRHILINILNFIYIILIYVNRKISVNLHVRSNSTQPLPKNKVSMQNLS